MVGVTKTQIAKRQAYHANPKKCRNCGGPIVLRDGVKLAEMKRRVFCSHSCAAIHTNRAAPKRQRKPRTCGYCGRKFVPAPREPVRKHCPDCRASLPPIVERRKGEVSRQAIASHARTVVADRPRACESCGYTYHVQVCHLRPVASFDDATLVGIVNAPANLSLLCPNCHWEHDHPSCRP